MEPTKLSEIREGCYDIHERIRDMNANGVAAALNFPSFPQFCGQYFARARDKDLGLAVLRAYNDWHIDQWCGAYPGRMIPQALPPIWEPTLMAEELRRVAEKGCHAVAFSEKPTKLGYPSLHDPHWDPFWRGCSDENTVVNLHTGSPSSVVITSADAPVDDKDGHSGRHSNGSREGSPRLSPRELVQVTTHRLLISPPASPRPVGSSRRCAVASADRIGSDRIGSMIIRACVL